MTKSVKARLAVAAAELDAGLSGLPMLLRPAAGPIGSVCREALSVIDAVSAELDQLNTRLEALENGNKK